jgi:hypothetical protein
MKWIATLIMQRRALRLYRRIQQHLPTAGAVADVGSGTGHNAQAIRNHTSLAVTDFDIADIHWVGLPPQRISRTDRRNVNQ